MTQLALFPTVTRPPLPPLELDPPGETGYIRNGVALTDGRLYSYEPFTAETHAAAVVEIVEAMQAAGHVGEDWWDTAVIYEAEHLTDPYKGGGAVLHWVMVSCEVET